MKKKYLAFFVAAVMLCSVFLPACGDEGYVEDETKTLQDATGGANVVVIPEEEGTTPEETKKKPGLTLIPIETTDNPEATDSDGKKQPTLMQPSGNPAISNPSTSQPGNTNNTVPEEPEKTYSHQIFLEEYLEIYVMGDDGFGYIYPKIDFEGLKAECAKYLIEDVEELYFRWSDCETPEDYLNKIFDKDYDDWSDIMDGDVDALTSLSNGETVSLTFKLPDDHLDDLLTAKIEPSVIEFTVTGLDPVESIDPFAFCTFYWYDMVVADGQIGYIMYSPYGVDSTVRLPTGDVIELDLMMDVTENQIVMPDETIRLYLESETIERYKSKYGENIFTRTEAYVRAGDVLARLATGDQAEEVFTNVSEEGMDNAKYAMKRLTDYYTETDTKVECIGMMFYYNDMAKTVQTWDETNYHNQLVFIFKITNAEKPEGWYSYLAYNGDICFLDELYRPTKTMETYTVGFYRWHMEDHYKYYRHDDPWAAEYYEYECYFEHNGATYPGHRSLADVFTAIKINEYGFPQYDHLFVTDSLRDYVTTY